MKKLALFFLVWAAMIAVGALAQPPLKFEPPPPPPASPFPTGHVMSWEEYWAKYPSPTPPHGAKPPSPEEGEGSAIIATPFPSPLPPRFDEQSRRVAGQLPPDNPQARKHFKYFVATPTSTPEVKP